MSTIAELKERLRNEGVRYFFGAYVDGLGVPKAKCVPLEHLDDAVGGSELYTVGALEAMGALGPNEDECVGLPDMETTTVLPWDKRYALAFADLHFRGQPYDHCSRTVLKRQIAAARAMGFGVNMGVEPEVYVLREEPNGDWLPFVPNDVLNDPTRGYDIETTMLADGFLEPMVRYMNELGWDIYSFDHEGGDGQYEFDFGYCDMLAMADRMVLFRLMSKHVARQLGCTATFMPKPYSRAFGSGAHFNISLADVETGRNAFEAVSRTGTGALGYSDIAYQFTAGVLKHVDAITAIVCPTVNSYKRLNPRGLMREMSWAPVYQAFGHNNRTLVCRLPMNRSCLELRHADSAVNFHLGAAITLAAGLRGIRDGLQPGDPVEFNTYEKSEGELAERGIRRLPRTLGEAIEAFANDELARETLGPAFHKTYTDYKRAEWDEYCVVVGEWERERYLHMW
jgi:glutamine synthetase